MARVPRGVFRCAKVLDEEGTLVLEEGMGDVRLPYGRDIRADHRIRALDRDLAHAGSASVDLVVAPEPPSAPAASASAPLALRPPSWGRVSRPAYVSRVSGRPARTRRSYPLGGSGVTTSSLAGPPGPPLAPLPLFTWEGSAQLGTPRPVNPAIWSSLGRSLGELPSILNNGVDHALIMALSRTLVRLRNEVAAIVSRPLGERDIGPLYQLGTADRSSAKAATPSFRNSLCRGPVASDSAPPGAERPTALAVSDIGEGGGASCPANSARLRNVQQMQRTRRRERSKIAGDGKAGLKVKSQDK